MRNGHCQRSQSSIIQMPKQPNIFSNINNLAVHSSILDTTLEIVHIDIYKKSQIETKN